jgi:hypothetical protein
MATFAVVTPIGIGVGIALSNDGEEAGTNTVATVVLQGMAAGTLLYVVFFEVLQRERANTQSGIWQLVAIMAGFAIMFALQLLCKWHCLLLYCKRVLASAIIRKYILNALHSFISQLHPILDCTFSTKPHFHNQILSKILCYSCSLSQVF